MNDRPLQRFTVGLFTTLFQQNPGDVAIPVLTLVKHIQALRDGQTVPGILGKQRHRNRLPLMQDTLLTAPEVGTR